MPRELFTSPLCPSQQVTEEQLATDQAVASFDQAVHDLNRRSFFSSLSAFGALAAAGALASLAPSARAQTAAPSIVDVLNFALNLEYLEATLYIAVSGEPSLLPYFDAGSAPITGLPKNLAFTDPVTKATFQNLALDESHHIETLTVVINQLGGTPIARPALDYTMGGKLNITTQAQLLALARAFSAVGTSAYTGGAPYLISNTLVLTAAAQILGAEAQHVGALGALSAVEGVAPMQVDALDFPPMPPNKYFTETSPTLAPLSGPALSPVRTPQQVLGIVFGVSTPSTTTPPPGMKMGGFFPAGVNGAITST